MALHSGDKGRVEGVALAAIPSLAKAPELPLLSRRFLQLSAGLACGPGASNVSAGIRRAPAHRFWALNEARVRSEGQGSLFFWPAEGLGYKPMKTRSRAALVTAIVGLAALLAPGCAKKGGVARARPVAPPTAAPSPAARGAFVPAQPAAAGASASWDAIKDLTFDQRADFSAGLLQMEDQLDAQIGDLKAKRAAMTADTKDWDFAMKGLAVARSYLQSTAAEAARATADTWDQEKDKVREAWLKAQDAYDKVRTSTTS